MAHRSSWPPVYPGLVNLPREQVTHGSPRFLISDTSTLVAAAGNTAIITHICQHAIHSAAEYCRRNNITFVNNEQLFEFLRKRSAAQLDVTEAPARDDAGRDKERGDGDAKPAGQRTKAGSSVKGRGRA